MNQPLIKHLGLQIYQDIYDMMHQFTKERTASTTDEIWFVEHYPVFTQGKVGKAEHLLHKTDIPVIKTDRGGQITYHGPGQQIMYILLDLKRLGIGIRDTVTYLENSVIKTLADYHVDAKIRTGAPGVYVNDKKICSLGLHISKGFTLHGLALNINMDITPFNFINPCGYEDLVMTQLKDYVADIHQDEIQRQLANYFIEQLPINR